MAILDPEFEAVLREQLPDLIDRRYGAVEPSATSAAAARVRRHALRRLVCADVLGLALAAFVGPLLLSLISDNPDSSAGHSISVYVFGLAVIPMFVAVFALYGLYRGTTRRISISVFSDLRNIVHALMISGFAYAVAAYAVHRALGVGDEEVTAAKIAAMCLVAWSSSPWPGRHPSASSDGPRTAPSRSSWWARANWPRPWPATFGPTPPSSSSDSSTTTRLVGAT